jgi:hypothetical protein
MNYLAYQNVGFSLKAYDIPRDLRMKGVVSSLSC